MARQDILLDDDNNFSTEDGDFVCGDSDDQHVELLCQLQPGELKENPTVGIGLNKYLKKQNTSINEIKQAIKVGLKADSYSVSDLTIDTNGEFELDYELDE